MEAAANVRTMEYMGKDDWDNPVYKCIETDTLWKDVAMGKGSPQLYSCGNEFDGDPCSPISSDLIVTFKTQYEESPYRFNYMLLDRLQSDCKYYLGYGNRSESCLWAGSVKEQIEKMMELHNSFPEGQKPEWLTYEGILDYEKQMSE
ncbi:LPD11 domain-containing protein [Cohnella soli]|uniref:LPD11 domain-containing protein n=1 Tax=Cohnella soli TaxID=425005 RepID=A0ABW0HQH3_9BACL